MLHDSVEITNKM